MTEGHLSDPKVGAAAVEKHGAQKANVHADLVERAAHRKRIADALGNSGESAKNAAAIAAVHAQMDKLIEGLKSDGEDVTEPHMAKALADERAEKLEALTIGAPKQMIAIPDEDDDEDDSTKVHEHLTSLRGEQSHDEVAAALKTGKAEAAPADDPFFGGPQHPGMIAAREKAAADRKATENFDFFGGTGKQQAQPKAEAAPADDPFFGGPQEASKESKFVVPTQEELMAVEDTLSTEQIPARMKELQGLRDSKKAELAKLGDSLRAQKKMVEDNEAYNQLWGEQARLGNSRQRLDLKLGRAEVAAEKQREIAEVKAMTQAQLKEAFINLNHALENKVRERMDTEAALYKKPGFKRQDVMNNSDLLRLQAEIQAMEEKTEMFQDVMNEAHDAKTEQLGREIKQATDVLLAKVRERQVLRESLKIAGKENDSNRDVENLEMDIHDLEDALDDLHKIPGAPAMSDQLSKLHALRREVDVAIEKRNSGGSTKGVTTPSEAAQHVRSFREKWANEAPSERIAANTAEVSNSAVKEREASSPEELMQNMEASVESAKDIETEIGELHSEMLKLAVEIKAVTSDAAKAVDEKYKITGQHAQDMADDARRRSNSQQIIQKRDQHFADHETAVMSALNTPQGKVLVEKYRSARDNLKLANSRLKELTKVFRKSTEAYLSQTAKGKPSPFFDGTIDYPEADIKKLPKMPYATSGMSADAFNPGRQEIDEYKQDSYLQYDTYNKKFSGGLNGPSNYNYGIRRVIDSL